MQAGQSSSHELMPEISSRTDELTAVVKLVAEQQRMSLLPAQQPPVFSGDHFDYATIISAFESLIECRVSDSKQRLHYLSQFTSGAPKESILRTPMIRLERYYRKDSAILIVLHRPTRIN